MMNKKLQRDIILGVKAGSYDMFNRLIDMYANRLISFCYSFCKSREEAEELSQDVFIKIWQNRKVLNENKNIDNYIYTIARNKCLNHLKSAGNQYKIKKIFVEEDLYQTDPSPLNDIIFNEYFSIAREAVDQLPERCKEVYILSRIDGLKNSDIAQRLGISINTVRVQIVKSNAFIKNYLRERTDLVISILIFFFFL